MSFAFIPHGVYEDIINIVGQWKVVDMKSLSEMCNYDIGYHNLLKKVRILETHGLIKGVLLGRKNKHIYLTNKGLKYTGHDYTYEICDENLTHDLIVSRVLKTLLTHKSFVDGRMFHQIAVDKIFPDAEASACKNGELYKLALEIELTQKEQSRVKEKYRRYTSGSIFTYGAFITNKRTLFKTYCRYLQEMKEDIQEAIILILDERMTATKFNYEKSECFYLGKSVDFSQLFDESGS
jgi:hypothetical protein